MGLNPDKVGNLANTKVKREVLVAFINVSPLPVVYSKINTKVKELEGQNRNNERKSVASQLDKPPPDLSESKASFADGDLGAQPRGGGLEAAQEESSIYLLSV